MHLPRRLDFCFGVCDAPRVDGKDCRRDGGEEYVAAEDAIWRESGVIKLCCGGGGSIIGRAVPGMGCQGCEWYCGIPPNGGGGEVRCG
jgi:hypothetical protein